MKDLADQQLLRAYVQDRSEPAFNELVRRYADLAYSAALRIVIDPHHAEDVSQRVFLALARNAHQLSPRTTLGGWLHSTTHNLAVMTVRSEERRRIREQKAAPMLSDSSANDSVWERIAPHLDAALNQLSDSDRDLVVLRFFQRKTAREIGRQLGLSEHAAQKRVARALERLRHVLRSHGLVLPSRALAGAISAKAVQAAPSGLAATLANHAVAHSAVSLSLAELVAKGLTISIPMKTHPIAAAIVVIACLSLGTSGFVSGQAAARKHHATVAWEASSPGANEPALDPASDQPVPPPAPPGQAPMVEPAPPSVAEILAQAAHYFRSQDTDPDAWVKGLAALEKLRPEDALNAVRHLESYKTEPLVFNRMGPPIMELWAQTDPHAAIDYTLDSFQDGTLAISLQRSLKAWAGQDPEAAWAWYRNFCELSDAPIASGDRTVEEKAQAVLDARKQFPDATLADLYDPLAMPPQTAESA
jgi:RNA polymerase sigma factor (sigma-70 family)